MRLDFNVLWVEDQQDAVVGQKSRIELLMRTEGFRLQVHFVASVDETTALLADDVYKDHIDLVLMDFNLGPGKRGDEGLEEVRELVPYRDIIFYSADATAKLGDLVAEKRVEGVFVAHRPDLPDTVFGVFNNLIRKTLDIDHVRGVAMGAFSEIEYAIGRALSNAFERCSDEQKNDTLELIRSGLTKKHREYQKDLDKVMAVNHVNELGKYHKVYTTDDKLKLLRKSIELTNLHTESLPNLDDYQTNIIQKRNDLAHIRVVKNGFARTFYDRNQNEISSEDMKELRIRLLEFEDFFAELFQGGNPDDSD